MPKQHIIVTIAYVNRWCRMHSVLKEANPQATKIPLLFELATTPQSLCGVPPSRNVGHLNELGFTH